MVSACLLFRSGSNFPHLKQTAIKEIQMNAKTLSYQNTATPKSQLFAGVVNTFNHLAKMIQRFKIKQAQVNYHAKMKHQAQAHMQQDMLRDLPLEQKLKLGCYHLMD
jgi:hypothetical protein